MSQVASQVTILTESVRVSTRGESQAVDVTGEVQALVKKHGFEQGHVLVFVSGSTAGLTTIEFEPGLLQDLPAALERIAPRGIRYAHHEQWNDGNGHSHVRASLLGPSLTVPFEDG